ncbi:MAG TPA: M20/M25/M40 family metallo-hydrolase [Gemmatimonadales bacterium]|nr:M20/M25/M40 family metallo-hydrolase [Gemmatimonadales bacterium]
MRLSRLLLSTLLVAAPLAAQERVDVATIERIKTEAMERSQVMDIMSWLTDVHGPRLTGSPITKAAGDWTIGTLKQWGVQNVRYEWWGPFGRGWVTDHFHATMHTPHPFQLIAYLAAWSPGTNGPQRGEVVRVKLDSMADLEALRGTLKGKWVLWEPLPRIEAHWQPLATRFTDEQLLGMTQVTPPTQEQQAASARPARPAGGRPNPAMNMAQLRQRFLVEEGVLGVFTPSTRDGGTLRAAATAPRQVDAPTVVPTIILSGEHYGRIWRLLDKRIPVEVTVDAKVTFTTDNLNSFNIIGEIPGTDPALKDEVVMIGAHFDSWHMGTGATDNGAGSATMLEAMRILRALDLKPRRTIAIGLWTGEEQGLIGSREYIAKHVATRDSTGVTPLPLHAKFSAYFNVDNGGGKIRGVFQQSNPEVGPIFDAWMAPFKDGGMKTLTITNTGGTDHLSFDGVGIPGFQFIQDPIEYGTRTHHTNMDVYERIQPDDMKWNAAVLAAFAWQAAQRDAKLPRKPMR